MREVGLKIFQEKYISNAFQIQNEASRFHDICSTKLEIASNLVKELKNKNHPARIVSQHYSPVVTIHIDSTKYDESSTPWSTFVVRLSKLLEVGEITSPRITWGKGSIKKDLAKKRNEEMQDFLDHFFAQTNYVAECSHLIPRDTPLFFNPGKYPAMNEDAFTPAGSFNYENIFFSDLFHRFTLDEIQDEFIDDRLEEEFDISCWDRQ